MSHQQQQTGGGHARRPGRSASFGNSGGHRGVSGGKGGGGGGSTAAPPQIPSSSSSHPPPSSNRSFKKPGNGQHRGNPVTNVGLEPVVASPPPRAPAPQNGSHVLQQQQGQSSDAATPVPVVSAGSEKPANVAAPVRNSLSHAVPKAPSSQPAPSKAAESSSSAASAAPKGDSPRELNLQFGSIIMNGLQIPARTSSAPPKLDEQKQHQALHGAFKAVPTMPLPSGPKPQQAPPRRDVIGSSQSNTLQSQAPIQGKRGDVHAPPPSATGLLQSGAPLQQPMTGMPMSIPIPYQSQLQFGNPNLQMQTQGLPSSVQMPIGFPAGNPSQVPHPMFFNNINIPPHVLQQQAMMHPGQGLGFAPPAGHQLGPQFSAHYPQQQGPKSVATRKTTVKITHPETHEELKLDKRTESYMDGGQRGLPNVTPQSQPVATFPTQIGYYPYQQNSYSPYFPGPTTVPLTSGQMPTASQGPRFNFPVSQPGQQISLMKPSMVNSVPAGNLDNTSGPATSAPVHLAARPNLSLHLEKVGSPAVTISVPPPKSEAPKIKPSEDATTRQQKDDEIASGSCAVLPATSAADQDHKSVVDRDTTAGVPLSSTQGPPAESLSTPAIAIAKSGPVFSGTEGKKKESIQKMATTKDSRKSAQQPQVHMNASALVKDVASDEGNQQTGRDSDKELHSAVSTSNPPSTDNESKISLEVGTTEVEIVPKSGTSERSASPSTVEMVVEAQKEENLSERESVKSETSSKTSIANDSSEVDSAGSVVHGMNSSEVNVDATDDGTDKKQLDLSEEAAQLNLLGEGMVEKSTRNAVASATFIDSDSVAAVNLASPDTVEEESSVQSVIGNEYEHESNEVLDSASSVVISELMQKPEGEVKDQSIAIPTSAVSSVTKEKPILEFTKTKSKKKRKEMLSKADAAGSSDLYNAYKGPEGKPVSIGGSEGEDSPTSDATQVPQDESEKHSKMNEEEAQNKFEPDDWEDAADISTPKLRALETGGQQVNGPKNVQDGDTSDASSRKKYSRDFLLTFAQQYTNLPFGFQIAPDVTDVLMSGLAGKSYVVDLEPIPSPGRVTDRPMSRGRDVDQWAKSPGPFSPGRDSRFEMINGPPNNFRPGPAVIPGVLRNPRVQVPNQHISGILSHPPPTRSGIDEKWQHKPLITSTPITPQPHQIMHKTDNRYQVGKVSDEEESKQRQLKGILNKLTPQNFEKLFAQVKEVNIDCVVTLTGVISQIFDKALTEPTFCEMYANFCSHLASALPDFSEDNEKITFKRLLLNKCQEEFERGEREEAEADKTEEEGEIKQTKQQREEKRLSARRRMLGNIRLIGELYKKKMLTERIMHECIKKLLGNYQNPDEEDVEALCKLMSTIGEMIDHTKAKEHMDAYFDIMQKLSTNQKLSSRVRFMLRDSIDLRKNKWQQRRKVEGPKKIDEVHRDAAQERQAQANRLARGPVISSVPRRGVSVEYGTRGSAALASPVSHQVGIRGMPPQLRGLGTQDARYEERHQFESRTSLPLPQRPSRDDSITLGPQGGLARNMSIRGQPLATNAEVASVVGDHRRLPSGPNGFNSAADWTSIPSRQDPNSRIVTGRSGGPYDQPGPDDHNVSWNSRSTERVLDRSASSTQYAARTHGASAGTQDSRPDRKSFSEEYLREKSISAIREYYSAKDEKEVALCIVELNAPSFYPSVVSLWVTDSFERKDVERELLAKLLVNLCDSRNCLITQSQLIQGLEAVLAILEDAVNDAPRAAEFLGQLFARFVLEDVLALKEIGRLISEGGEEPGYLVDIGLAADVLAGTLESIRLEKGDSVLNQIRASSNLKTEDFRPAHVKRSKLDAFI